MEMLLGLHLSTRASRQLNSQDDSQPWSQLSCVPDMVPWHPAESSRGPCAVASVLTGPCAIGHVPLVYRGGSCCWQILRTCPKSPARSGGAEV